MGNKVRVCFVPFFLPPSRSLGLKHDGCQNPSLSFRMKAKDLFTAVRRRPKKKIRPVTSLGVFSALPLQLWHASRPTPGVNRAAAFDGAAN